MSARKDWLPYGIVRRKAVFKSIAVRIDDFGPQIGLSQGQIDRIKAISAEYDFAVDIYERNRVTNKALRAWRDSVISNERSTKLAVERPIYDNSPAPAGTRLGLVAEMRGYVALMKASPGFTSAMGAAMNIMSPDHAKKPLSEIRPVPKVTAVEGFQIRIACEMQGMDVLQVEYQRNGEENWQRIAFLTSLPETIYIEPAVRGVPETGKIRCIYYKKNKIVGIYSQMPTVTIFGS
ncbi:MAG: hypothetical protein AB7J13_14715 [Pyrinomonadaceae bacterium]